MPRLGLIIFFYFLLLTFSYSQFNFDSIFSGSSLLKKISSSPSKYKAQIIYTQIDSTNGKPGFTNYYFNVNSENYFYCASLVKLPVSILALQKLNEINVKADAIMFTDSSIACHKKVKRDTSSLNKFPSIENYIKRMLLVSDNESFSRTYEFLGVDYIHRTLQAKGYPDIRIINRYDGNCSGKNSVVTNPIVFMDENLKIIYKQEQLSPAQPLTPLRINMNVGKAYYDLNNKRINKPKNFSGSNYLNLVDCHSFLQELIFNHTNKFNLTSEQRKFLREYLSYYPRQSSVPRYDPKVYYDSYKKYLFYGDSKTAISDTNLIITNIVGQSYGFMSDCAYFSDKKNNISFMLSAVIYANEDEILNDGKYDYKTVALPYLAELGRQFYKYEIKRKNKSKE